jgi:hypothetical protein
MGSLSSIGRIFYGIAIAGIVIVSMYYHKLPYILGPGLIPQGPRLLHLPDWENAAKVLAFVGGALVLAGGKIGRFGAILFAITIVDFGILHFMEAVEAAPYVPAWIPYHVFWMYFCGAALIASGIAIILRTKQKLAAALLGAMILTWFVILHIPRVMVAQVAMDGELDSALFALAYSGTAFVICGAIPRRVTPYESTLSLPTPPVTPKNRPLT